MAVPCAAIRISLPDDGHHLGLKILACLLIGHFHLPAGPDARILEASGQLEHVTIGKGQRLTGVIGLDRAGNRLARREGSGNNSDGLKNDCGSKKSTHWRFPLNRMHGCDVMDRAWTVLEASETVASHRWLEKCRQFPFPMTIFTPKKRDFNLNEVHVFSIYSRII
jgi:hypothetical protein